MTCFLKRVVRRQVLKNGLFTSQEADQTNQLDESQEVDRRNQLDDWQQKRVEWRKRFVVNQSRRKSLGRDLLHRRQGTARGLKQVLRL